MVFNQNGYTHKHRDTIDINYIYYFNADKSSFRKTKGFYLLTGYQPSCLQTFYNHYYFENKTITITTIDN